MGKRRPSGDGLVRKRADGRWEGRIVVGHKEDGKPIYRSVFAEKQGDLMPKLHELKDQYAGVELTEDSSITLGEWLERWLNEYKKPILRPSTYAGYSKDIANHILPFFGSKRITQLKTGRFKSTTTAFWSRGAYRITARAKGYLTPRYGAST